MFWFIVLLLFVGAGFYFYQKMMTIEREIRAEQKIEKAHIAAVQEPDKRMEETPQKTVFDSETSPAPVVPERAETSSLEATIFAKVTEQPGIKQTELYPLFAATNKKQLQQSIKKMADKGVLRREKQGSSFLLYPV